MESKKQIKTYCDLLLTNDNSEFIEWLSNVEKHVQDNIYEKKDSWFHTPLDRDDIENFFTSPLNCTKATIIL